MPSLQRLQEVIKMTQKVLTVTAILLTVSFSYQLWLRPYMSVLLLVNQLFGEICVPAFFRFTLI